MDGCLIFLAGSGRADRSTCGLIAHLSCPTQSNCPFISASVCSRKPGEDASRRSLSIGSSLKKALILDGALTCVSWSKLSPTMHRNESVTRDANEGGEPLGRT